MHRWETVARISGNKLQISFPCFFFSDNSLVIPLSGIRRYQQPSRDTRVRSLALIQRFRSVTFTTHRIVQSSCNSLIPPVFVCFTLIGFPFKSLAFVNRIFADLTYYRTRDQPCVLFSLLPLGTPFVRIFYFLIVLITLRRLTIRN